VNGQVRPNSLQLVEDERQLLLIVYNWYYESAESSPLPVDLAFAAMGLETVPIQHPRCRTLTKILKDFQFIECVYDCESSGWASPWYYGPETSLVKIDHQDC
jgi:hypothetical protein